MNLEEATTEQLLDELELRMKGWPQEMMAPRAFLRGTIGAVREAGRRYPGGAYERMLNRRRLQQ